LLREKVLWGDSGAVCGGPAEEDSDYFSLIATFNQIFLKINLTFRIKADKLSLSPPTLPFIVCGLQVEER
jgi:hypothetical protein